MKIFLRTAWLTLTAAFTLALVALILSLTAALPPSVAAIPRDTPAPDLTPVVAVYLPSLARGEQPPKPTLNWHQTDMRGVGLLGMINATEGWGSGLNSVYRLHGGLWEERPPFWVGWLRAFSPLTDGHVWARTDTQIWRWDGATWADVPKPIESVTALHMVSDRDGWAATNPEQYHTTMLHWNGQTWEPGVTLGFEGAIFAAAPDGAIWVTGDISDNIPGYTCISHLNKWDGTTWTIKEPPAHVCPSSLQVLADDDIWISGSINMWDRRWSSSKPALMHWDGHSWENQVPPNMQKPKAEMPASYDGWMAVQVGADTQLWHWDSQRWTLHDTIRNAVFIDLQMTSTTDGWLSTTLGLWHYTAP